MSINIEDYFLPEDLVNIFSKVFDNLKQSYLSIFDKLEIESRFVAQRYNLSEYSVARLCSRVRDELDYFIQDLKTIKVTNIVPTSELEAIVRDIIDNRCNPYLEITSIN